MALKSSAASEGHEADSSRARTWLARALYGAVTLVIASAFLIEILSGDCPVP
ncbi:MAG: hypothetical protein AAF481_07295 [Acidobacteriota bacterium]